jgi:hypothetical protein
LIINRTVRRMALETIAARAACNRRDRSQRGEKQRLRAIVVRNL